MLLRTILATIAFAALLTSAEVKAAPFAECPIEAFLIQDKYAKAYGVNLGTGYYQLLAADMGTSSKLNAAGFNYHDAHLYAWSYQHSAPVRIGDDYIAEPLQVTGLPRTNFYVGDVAVTENAYYIYQPGSAYGLYRIPLDGDTPYAATKVVDGGSLNLRIYDLAFHPDNGYAYAVDGGGTLWRIEVGSGSSTNLGATGESGTFGAAYFDRAGTLYVSRNSDGNIFRINPEADSPRAELFAQGPASSNNDGARCALAPVISADSATVDFGDAPASYGTYLNDNGARHDQTGNSLFFGELVDGEADAWVSPLSDSENGSIDEDGIAFVTGIETASNAVVSMTASAQGYVSAWLDFDQNGSFDDSEQIVTGLRVSPGRNNLAFYVPLWAAEGSTWARFRISSSNAMSPKGGLPDGEVEDYAVEITPTNVVQTHYPSANEWSTLAFEDTWPIVGDYDMNDVVVHQRVTQYRDANDGALLGVRIRGEVAAIGASFHNGFAIRIPGVARDEVVEESISFKNNYAATDSPLEQNRNEAIVVIANDLWDHIDPGENCEFYRTSANCGGPAQMVFDIFLPIDRVYVELETVLDPFIYATPGFYRDGTTLGAPGRGLEIHLKNQQPTEAFDRSLFGLGDDNSNDNVAYQTASGMPWALEISQRWAYPLSGIDLVEAYPEFSTFVRSLGTEGANWYTSENSVQNLTFKE